MSKKDKSKFRKRLRAQILQDFQSNQKTQASAALSSPMVQPAQLTNSQPLETSTIPNSDIQTHQIASDSSTLWVKKDLKKSAIIIGSIIIIIVGLYFLDIKYNLLINAGNQIFRVLNINS